MKPEIRATRRLEDARIGNRAASLRKERRVTLADAANNLGISETELTEREVGKCSFLAAEIVSLSILLGVSPGHFFEHLAINVTDEPFSTDPDRQ